MFTMGTDFTYDDADSWFRNLDKIISLVNADGRVKVMYSTPSAYVEAKLAERLTWPLKKDDFFPYADGPHKFWTGYFTSRPALKRYIRSTSAILQAGKQLCALADPGRNCEVLLRALMEAQATAQHHDAVSGTSKQHVAFDYAKKLSRGVAKATQAMSHSLVGLLPGISSGPFLRCELLNVSQCTPLQQLSSSSSPLVAVAWNALGQDRTELVELPLPKDVHVSVVGGLQVQVIPSLDSITNYGPSEAGAPYTAVVQVRLPALGYTVLRVEPTATPLKVSHPVKPTGGQPTSGQHPGAAAVLENEFLRLTFCRSTGMLCQVTNKEKGISADVLQDFFFYKPMSGNGQNSGAYIFRPAGPALPVRAPGTSANVSVVFGPLMSEVRQDIAQYLRQRVRLGRGMRAAQFTFTVGDLTPYRGMEVVMRFSTNLSNPEGLFYTDSNGREMIPRRVNFRPSWDLHQTEPVAGNYYPVATAIAVPGTDAQLTLLTETEWIAPYVNCFSLVCGQHYGPGLIIRGSVWLTLEPPASAAAVWRPLQDRIFSPPHLSFGPVGSRKPFDPSAAAKLHDAAQERSFVVAPLP
eukprot:RCo042878